MKEPPKHREFASTMQKYFIRVKLFCSFRKEGRGRGREGRVREGGRMEGEERVLRSKVGKTKSPVDSLF